MILKNICFRLNSNEKIGIGHAMRCVRIARILNKKGHNCIFYIDHKSDLEIFLKEFKVDYIYNYKNGYKNQVTDAQAFLNKINVKNSIVVVDDYRLDFSWEKIVSKKIIKLIVIDDSENKKHYCSTYINYKPNLNNIKNFNTLLMKNKDTDLLLGSKYSIIDCGIKYKKKNNNKKVFDICFYMGGSGDFKFFDKVILKLIDFIPLTKKKLRFNVISGIACKNLKNIISLSKKYKFLNIINGKKKIDKVICNMDLIVGSAGNIVYESSYYNIPSLFFEISKNQKNDLFNMEKIGHYFLLPISEIKNFKKIAKLIFLMIKNYNRIYKLSLKKEIKVDNKGVLRIAKNITEIKKVNKNFNSKLKYLKFSDKFFFRKVQDNEINRYLKSRNLPVNRKVSVSVKKINRLDHYIWWFSTKRDSFVMIINNNKIMYLYDETINIKNKNYSLQGWFACGDKLGIKEILIALNWHQKYMKKKQEIDLSFGIIKKGNKINFSKYLSWNPVQKNSHEYEILKKICKVDEKYNYYSRY